MSVPSGTLRFPEELRLRGSVLPRAGGRLAHATLSDGSLQCTIDGMRAVVDSWSGHAYAHEATSVWPWGLELERTDDSTRARLVQRVFVAPEHPLVALEWEATDSIEIAIEIALDEGLRATASDADHARRTGASTWTLALVAGEPVRILLAPEGQEPPVAALFASAIARARRRAASRPLLIRVRSLTGDANQVEPVGGTDLIAPLEHAMRVVHDVDHEDATRVGIAMLALNDTAPVSELLTDARAGAFHPALLGALAGWTGTAEVPARNRARYVEWLGSELATLTAGDPEASAEVEEAGTAIRQVALAFAPAVVELLGERMLAVALRDVSLPDAHDALANLARTAASGPAARAAASVLGLFHHSLGVSPDAPRGRVRLGLRLAPRDWVRLERLRVGDAVFRVDASMAVAGVARIRVEQTAGAAPNTLIVEPWLPGTRLRAAAIDGSTAELDFVQTGDGIRPRVQLVADHPRNIILHCE